MAASLASVFAKHQVARDDGVEVLSKPLISVAAVEAGYFFDPALVTHAVINTRYPGQMTKEEFTDFCESNASSRVSVTDMAKSMMVVAPTGTISRGSLHEIVAKCSPGTNSLSEAEIDSLFTALDTESKGTISAEDMMRAMYGEEGAVRLAEVRKLELTAARAAEEKNRAANEAAAAAALADAKRREADAKAKEAAQAADRAKDVAKQNTKKKTSVCC